MSSNIALQAATAGNCSGKKAAKCKIANSLLSKRFEKSETRRSVAGKALATENRFL